MDCGGRQVPCIETRLEISCKILIVGLLSEGILGRQRAWMFSGTLAAAVTAATIRDAGAASITTSSKRRHPWRPQTPAARSSHTSKSQRGACPSSRNFAQQFLAKTRTEPKCLYYGFCFQATRLTAAKATVTPKDLAHLDNVGDLFAPGIVGLRAERALRSMVRSRSSRSCGDRWRRSTRSTSRWSSDSRR